MLNNNIDLNNFITNRNGNFEFRAGNQRYEVKRAATEGEILTYGVIGGVIICALAPAIIPSAIAWSGLLGSLYGIASIIKDSEGGQDNEKK